MQEWTYVWWMETKVIGTSIFRQALSGLGARDEGHFMDCIHSMGVLGMRVDMMLWREAKEWPFSVKSHCIFFINGKSECFSYQGVMGFQCTFEGLFLCVGGQKILIINQLIKKLVLGNRCSLFMMAEETSNYILIHCFIFAYGQIMSVY